MFKPYLLVAVGAALALILNTMIAGILNPILTPLKITYV